MIESVQFQNFKVLRDATLPLSRFTLIVGPNGSGKSTAMQALQATARPQGFSFERITPVGSSPDAVEVILWWGSPHAGAITRVRWNRDDRFRRHESFPGSRPTSRPSTVSG